MREMGRVGSLYIFGSGNFLTSIMCDVCQKIESNGLRALLGNAQKGFKVRLHFYFFIKKNYVTNVNFNLHFI